MGHLHAKGVAAKAGDAIVPDSGTTVTYDYPACLPVAGRAMNVRKEQSFRKYWGTGNCKKWKSILWVRKK